MRGGTGRCGAAVPAGRTLESINFAKRRAKKWRYRKKSVQSQTETENRRATLGAPTANSARDGTAPRRDATRPAPHRTRPVTVQPLLSLHRSPRLAVRHGRSACPVPSARSAPLRPAPPCPWGRPVRVGPRGGRVRENRYDRWATRPPQRCGERSSEGRKG